MAIIPKKDVHHSLVDSFNIDRHRHISSHSVKTKKDQTRVKENVYQVKHCILYQ